MNNTHNSHVVSFILLFIGKYDCGTIYGLSMGVIWHLSLPKSLNTSCDLSDQNCKLRSTDRLKSSKKTNHLVLVPAQVVRLLISTMYVNSPQIQTHYFGFEIDPITQFTHSLNFTSIFL